MVKKRLGGRYACERLNERPDAMPKPHRIERRVVPCAHPDPRSPGRIAREFASATDGGRAVRVAGSAQRSPRRLLRLGYTPKYRLDLLDATFYVTNVRQNEDIRFFVGYVSPRPGAPFHARIFYKDLSLVWRSASHFVRSDRDNWIGKGDVKPVWIGGEPKWESAEHTTDLPFELQPALEALGRRVRRVPYDDCAVALVLRRGPEGRIHPYRDFSEPRRRAEALRSNRVRGGRRIARFERKGDPTTLRFAPGYGPDFAGGVRERDVLTSRLYGGRIRRYRILSENRCVQFLFFAGPRQVWMGYPQATTTELTSYGVRSIEVTADDDAFLPGFEYHFLDHAEDPPVFVTQIPAGYAGPQSTVDPSRADASPWLDRLPVIRAFRRRVLGQRASR